MHRLILFVRDLRNIPFFKHGIRFSVVFLMLAGMWVATRDMDIIPGITLSDKLIHAVVFFGFAVLADLSTSRKPFWFWKGLPLLVYGACIEIMQYYTPERSFSVLDWIADFSGVLLYFIIKRILVWIDRKRSSIP
ncbi:MAG TPA: VanZ family protein [Leucothrix mucor]|nr:VanZ family protein [Leucothrix mucor]